jgi:lipid-A-disaccharide synthase
MTEQEPLIFIVSGETSGDNLAGKLMEALKHKTGGRIRFAGVGGAQSEQQGLTSLFPISDLSLMGLAEVLPHLPRLLRRINETSAAVRELKPAAVVTVDAPGFNLRLARQLRGSGIPVIHYVAPQLWAWAPFRARKLKECVDHIMALLPFEVSFFEEFGIDCTYVGHPAIDGGVAHGDGPAFRSRHGIPSDAPILCVLPGSRGGEVRRMVPVFGQALLRLKEKYPDLHVVIPAVHSVVQRVTDMTRDWPSVLIVDTSERLDAFAAADAAMAKSGTGTLELALANVPMVVAYRISPISAFLVRRMGVSVSHASLVNLLAGREVVPEYLQEDCTPERLAAAVDEILGSKQVRTSQQHAFKEVLHALGDPTPPPSDRAAKLVLEIIGTPAAKANASRS